MVARCFPAGERVCGRRDLNPHERLSSADFLTGYGFRRPGALAGFAVWTIPSPCPAEPGLGAARLVSTPSRPAFGPGLARDRHVTGFPEFGQFCIAGFPTSTQVFHKSAASAIPPRPLRSVPRMVRKYIGLRAWACKGRDRSAQGRLCKWRQR